MRNIEILGKPLPFSPSRELLASVVISATKDRRWTAEGHDIGDWYRKGGTEELYPF